MSKARLTLMTLSAAAALALVAAGCGGSSSSSTTSSSDSAGSGGYGGYGQTSQPTSGGTASVDVADNPKLGPILVDAQGRTLYLFEKDESDESYCSGACAEVWAPVTTDGTPMAGKGVAASKLTTLKRDDGSTQVVFDGHPLYLYAEDTKPGDAKGNELDQFGAEWYALHPNGANAE